MAYITNFTCKTCNLAKREVSDRTGECVACRTAESDRARRVHLAGLEGLTLEERVKRIEELLYDLDATRRLNAIESKVMTVY